MQIVNEVNGIHAQTGSANGASVQAPPTIGAINVTASNGFFSITITDPAGQAQSNLGLHRFLEWDTNPNFPNPTVEDISAANGEYIFLGNLTTYWRAKSQFRNSPLSSPYVYFGSKTNPTAVTGGGAAGGTAPGGGSGSGGGGGGFGGGGRGGGCPLSGAPVELFADPGWWTKRVMACEEFIVITTETGRTGIFSRADRRYSRRGLLPLYKWVVGDYAVTLDGEERVTSLTPVRIKGATVDSYEATQGHVYAAWGFIGHNVKIA